MFLQKQQRKSVKNNFVKVRNAQGFFISRSYKHALQCAFLIHSAFSVCYSYCHPLWLLFALPFSSLVFPHCPAWAVFYFPICFPSSLRSTGHPRASSIHDLENKLKQSSSAFSFIPMVLISLWKSVQGISSLGSELYLEKQS